MALRTLYLQRYLSINGRNAIGGRALYDRFHELSEETLLAHIVYHDEDFAGIKDARLRSDVASQALLRDFQPNVVFIEQGLFANSQGIWKVPEDITREICNSGGVIIVADVDHNELREHKDHYRQAASFFKTQASYGPEDLNDPVYGSDERRFWRGYRQILCDPAKMVISDWIRPIYEGIPEILVGLPIRLASWESIIASCNSDSTGTLQLDQWVDQIDVCPFAAAAQVGNGFAVLIAGNVSGDAWLDGCPNNTTWLTNLADFLVNAALSDHGRRTSHRRSPYTLFLSHRSSDKKVVALVAKAIKHAGVNVWLDAEQLIPGQSLVAEINRALGQMTHFVLFWSSHCLGAPWVERELNSAVSLLVEKKVPLFIVRLDNTPVPSLIADLLRIEAAGEMPDMIAAQLVRSVERLERRMSA